MDFKVVWTEPAIDAFEVIVGDIAAANPRAAERVADGILHRVDLLKTFPFPGAVYPESSSGRVHEVLSGKYRIFYRVSEEARLVEVLTVWHGARQEPDLPA